MKHKSVLTIIGIAMLSLAMPSCVPPDDVQQSNNTIAADLHIRLERTPCFGMCPAYSVDLTANGTISWVGKMFVKDTGNATAHATPATVLVLQSAALDANFFSMDSVYNPNVADCPGALTTVTYQGVTKRIVDNQCGAAPAALRDYEKLIDSLLGTGQWVK